MSIFTLPVMLRNEVGSNSVKRLRKEGVIPTVLYGHKQECVNLSVTSAVLHDALKAKARMVQLEWDSTKENAIVKEVQYDYLGDNILHVDFARVDVGEKVTVDVPVELYGEPIGHKKHGVLTHLLKNVVIECVVTAIPEKIRADVSGLDLDQSILVKDLVIPEGASITNSPDSTVASVHVVVEKGESEEEVQDEPEVIASKKESGEGEE